MNATSSAPSPPYLFRLLDPLLFLAVLALALPQAALIPLLDRDEPRFAEASREMLQSGNFVVPTFNHAPRYAKPPLSYWCQAASFTLLGENAFSARLPSLLATAGTALLLFAWGTQIGSAQMGLGAALSYAFCFQTAQQGRVATADALLIFFMTLTAFAGWKLITSPPPNRSTRSYFWDTILAFGFAGGFLAKGPEALLPLVPLLICARGTRSNLTAEVVVNFIIGLALVLLWAIPAYIETHGDYWRVGMSEGVGQRMVTGLQGHGASTFGWYLLGVLFYYPLFFLLGALPWWPLLFVQRKKLFTDWKLDRVDVYLLLNAGLIIVIFSLMVTKLPHYTLPAFPFLALLFARRWIIAGIDSPGASNEVFRGSRRPPGDGVEEPALGNRGLPTKAEASLAKSAPKRLKLALPIKLGWTTGIVLALSTAVLVPLAIAGHATPSPVGELVRDARDVLAPETEFALVDFREPNAIWEMRRVVKGYGEFIPEAEVITFLNRPGAHAVVLSTALWQRIGPNSFVTHPSWKVFEARGWNTAKGWDSTKGTFAFIDLTLVVKP